MECLDVDDWNKNLNETFLDGLTTQESFRYLHLDIQKCNKTHA